MLQCATTTDRQREREREGESAREFSQSLDLRSPPYVTPLVMKWKRMTSRREWLFELTGSTTVKTKYREESNTASTPPFGLAFEGS
jgi:hypothetical protein